MTRPVRLQLSRRRGFDLQAHSRGINGLPAVAVVRPRRFGNPFVIGEAVDLDMARKWGWLPLGDPGYVAPDAHQAVRRFRAVLILDEAIHNHVRAELAGKNLACWCRPGDPCHADVLLDLANREGSEEPTGRPQREAQEPKATVADATRPRSGGEAARVSAGTPREAKR